MHESDPGRKIPAVEAHAVGTGTIGGINLSVAHRGASRWEDRQDKDGRIFLRVR
jgi:hypothetical protein